MSRNDGRVDGHGLGDGVGRGLGRGVGTSVSRNVGQGDGAEVGAATHSFLYHVIVVPEADATTSRSRSPSRSTATAEYAPSADVVMMRSVNVGKAPPSFSHQEIVPSSEDTARISMSRSPSKSATETSFAPSAEVVRTWRWT